MTGTEPIEVEVAYALPEVQTVLTVSVPAGASVEQAIRRSGILERFPEIDLSSNPVGIFSSQARLQDRVSAGDQFGAGVNQFQLAAGIGRVRVGQHLLSRQGPECRGSRSLGQYLDPFPDMLLEPVRNFCRIGEKLQREGIELDTATFAQALQDAAQARPSRYSAGEMAEIDHRWRKSRQSRRLALAEQNGKAGEFFLKENGKRDGVITTDSGLQYKTIKAGSGKNPDKGGTVVVHYRGSLINGEEFDSSYGRGEPTTLVLDHVIKGWQETLPLMNEGAKWQVVIPASLAYGPSGQGSVIGPDATLIFDIELISVN